MMYRYAMLGVNADDCRDRLITKGYSYRLLYATSAVKFGTDCPPEKMPEILAYTGSMKAEDRIGTVSEKKVKNAGMIRDAIMRHNNGDGPILQIVE